LVENDFRGLYVADEQVDAILRGGPERTVAAELTLRIRHARQAISARVLASTAAGIELPLPKLSRALAMDALEEQVFIACAAADVELNLETLFAYVQNDVNRKRPTADLLLRMFIDTAAERFDRRKMFSADSKLVTTGLIRAVEVPAPDGQSFLARAFRTDDRVTGFLLGSQALDARLNSLAHVGRDGLCLRDLLLPVNMRDSLSMAAQHTSGRGALFIFFGPRGSGKRSAAQAISNASRRSLIVADMARAVASSVALGDLIALLHREAFLQDANLLLENCHALLSEKASAAQHLATLEKHVSPVANMLFVAAETQLDDFSTHIGQPAFSYQFPVPSYEHRLRLWERAICQTDVPAPSIDIPSLAGKFAFTAGQIHATVRAAATQPGSFSTAGLQCAARERSGHGLRKLAQKIESRQAWSDLVLPARAMQQLQAVSASHKFRDLVYSNWGFGNKLAMGKGLNVLFFGPSGTGKTMAASILANALGLDIYKIDLSSVVSKYIGETEKQLSQIFREAQTSNAILLFDEADALFGKRSEVKDAHDRYANVETAYLLQKMEEYDGIVVLTTNFRKNMDDAFARRMHHMVEFSLPDVQSRLRIWKGLIPGSARLDADADLAFLARQFELSGGSIRNAVLAAAFLAAEEGPVIRMKHLIIATARELQKLGKLPSRSDFKEYADLVHSQA